VAEEVGEKAQAQQPHGQQQQTREEGQRDGHRPILGGSRHGMLTYGCRRHERNHRHRPHGEHATGAEDGVEQQRRHAGVQAHLGRQAREHGVGQALGDQHDGDDQSRHAIAHQRLAAVRSTPLQHGQGRQELAPGGR